MAGQQQRRARKKAHSGGDTASKQQRAKQKQAKQKQQQKQRQSGVVGGGSSGLTARVVSLAPPTLAERFALLEQQRMQSLKQQRGTHAASLTVKDGGVAKKRRRPKKQVGAQARGRSICVCASLEPDVLHMVSTAYLTHPLRHGHPTPRS